MGLWQIAFGVYKGVDSCTPWTKRQWNPVIPLAPHLCLKNTFDLGTSNRQWHTEHVPARRACTQAACAARGVAQGGIQPGPLTGGPGRKTGWIAAGYLDPQPPPVLRLEQLEAETGTLRTQLEEIRAEASKLRESNATLASTDSGQREQIESLKIENYELRAGSRYQEWITGALILASGMILGAFLHRNSTRRPSSRIRL